MKNTATATTAPATTTETLKPIRTKHLAIKFGMKATMLRRILRSMPAYADGVHTNYSWSENDPAITAIQAQINKLTKEKEERAKAAKAALLARTEAAAKQAKVDAAAVPAK